MQSPPYISNEELVRVLPKIKPITFFYHALSAYGQSIKHLKKRPSSFSRTSEFTNTQKIMLDALHLLYSDMDDCRKCSRQYLRPLGPFMRREFRNSFSQTTFQYCIAISHGLFTDEQFLPLQQNASLLFSVFEAIRYKLEQRTLSSTLYPYDDIYPLLEEFDWAWTAFESQLVDLTISSKPPLPEDDLGLIQFITNETVAKLISSGTIKQESIQDRDPILFVAIPRLILLSILIEFLPLLDITDPELNFSWYKQYTEKLQRLTKLKELPKDKLNLLTSCLINGSNSVENYKEIEFFYLEISEIADMVAAEKAVVWTGILGRTFSIFQ